MNRLKRQHYGLAVYEADDGHEYAVGSEERADRAAQRAVRDSIWSFKTESIVSHLTANRPRFARMSERMVEKFTASLRKIQEDLCDNADPIIRALLGPAFKSYVEKIIREDGRGCFLAGYDSEERQSSDVPGLPKGRFAYRIN